MSNFTIWFYWNNAPERILHESFSTQKELNTWLKDNKQSISIMEVS